VGGSSYGGIGASTQAFKNQNPTAQGSGELPNDLLDGVAYYQITSTNHGCVTGYSITEKTSPPQGARDLLSLVAGVFLPDDAKSLVDQDTCAVWQSAALKTATGLQYAVGSVLRAHDLISDGVTA
jgi:hypothetical protein